MPEVHYFDPAAEGTGTELAITLGSHANYSLLEQSYPAPPLQPITAGSIDTEGERFAARKHGNREIRHRWDVIAASESALETAVNALAAKVAKLAREGGTFKRVSAAGESRTYDILGADGFDRPLDITYYTGKAASVGYVMTAKPYSRGPEQDLGENVETSLPVLIWTDTIPGDVWALGRLVLDNDAAASQYSFIWGVESRYYNAANALLFDATGTADGGSYGGSTRRVSIISNTPTTVISWSGYAHVGMYRVLARMRHNPWYGTPAVAQLTWSAGASTSATNPAVYVTKNLPPTPPAQNYRIVDLGTVTLPKPVRGNPNFSGTISAWIDGTAGSDTIDLDYWFLVPVMEGSGRANGTLIPGSGTLQTPVLTANKSAEIRWDGAMELTNSGSDYWGPVTGYAGDYMLVPNSGSENRPARFIVKMSRGLIREAATTGNGYDGGSDTAVDDLSARLYVVPRYLT